MNNGAFGENFPYSNFHDLNMDWIIKIAKDFLDQYTHIQEVIANGEESLQNLTTSGLTQLQEKADALEALLQQWYDTHSADIANQLADALEDLNQWYTEHEGFLNQYLQDSIVNFTNAVTAEGNRVLNTIPSDYTQLSNDVSFLKRDIKYLENFEQPAFTMEQGAISSVANVPYADMKAASNTRIRSAGLLSCDSTKTYNVTIASGFEFIVYAFSESGNSVYDALLGQWTSDPLTVTGHPKYAFAVRRSNNANISPSDMKTTNFLFHTGALTAKDNIAREQIANVLNYDLPYIKQDISYLSNWTQPAYSVESGGITGVANTPYQDMKIPAENRIRCVQLLDCDSEKTYTVKIASGFEFVIWAFSNSGNSVYDAALGQWTSGPLTVSRHPKYAFAIRKTNSSNITPSELGATGFYFYTGDLTAKDNIARDQIERTNNHIIHGIPYSTKAIVNMNNKTVTLPSMYLYSNEKSYDNVSGTTVDFSSISYYAWIYFNITSRTYEALNNFNFNKNKALIMLIAMGNFGNPIIQSAVPYTTVYGHIGFIGDSLTAGDGGTPYCEDVAKALGMDFYNYGHSGCSFTLASGNTFKDYITTYADNLDIITIWGGINDFLWFDNFDIFEQEFESFINQLLNRYPGSKFMILTPQKFYLTASSSPGVRSPAWNVPSSGDNKTLEDYVNVEKRIAEKYQIPVLDMYSVGVPCVNTTQRSRFYNGSGDWLHPNTTGYQFIANRIAEAIKNL